MSSSEKTAAAKVSRRQVREATVQLMHSGHSQESEASDPWPLILAHQEGKITRTRARAILHLQQNRPGRVKPVFEQRVNAISLLESFVEEKSAPRTLRSLLKAEGELPELFDLLKRQLKSEKDLDDIAETLERIRQANQTALDCLSLLLSALGPLDACPEPLKPLARALPPLEKTAHTLRSLLSKNLPEVREVAALQEAIAERDHLRKETESLHALVLKHLESTDQLIAQQVENFAPDRLAQVDRAVLRLATTELKHCPDIPPAVSIDEAIEIARRFGGSESAGFVNGILDKLK